MKSSSNDLKKHLIKENDTIWSILVRMKYGNVCVMCGDGKPKPVSAHHIFGRSHKATRWITANGIPLCYYHHRFCIHGGRCEPEDVVKFYKRVIGEETYEWLKQESQKHVKFNLAFVMDWNHKLRGEFLGFTGMSYEEYKNERRHKHND